MSDDGIRLTGRKTGTFAVSTSVAKTANPLPGGEYDVWADVDVFITTGPATLETALTAANGYKIFSGAVVGPIIVQHGEYLHAIAGGSGNIYYFQTGG